MPQITKINEITDNPPLNISLDTIEKNKQALIFTSSKRSAEKTAEDISKKIKNSSSDLINLSEKILKALPKPTKQCERLSRCIKYGIAFHHAGLTQKQKEIIEDAFREGKIKVIACTPTLAIGMDLPAYRAVIKDLKRFSGSWGARYIPVLEYHQMCLPYNYLISTNKGMIKIGDIVEDRLNVKITSYNVKKNKVELMSISKYYKRKSNNLIELENCKGIKIKATPSHPILIKRDNKIVWKKFSEVENGDKMMFLTKSNPSNVKIKNFLDLVPIKGTYTKGQGHLISEVKYKKNITEKVIAKITNTHYKLMYHYKNNIKAMPLSLIIKLWLLLGKNKDNLSEKIKKVKTRYGSYIDLSEGLSEDLFWLIGMMATDGNINRTIDSRTKSEYIKIRVHNTNKKIIDKSKKILKRVIEGKVYESKRDDGLYTIEIGATLLARILKKHFGIPYGNKTTNVKIPKILYKAPLNLVGAYLGGVFDGDGSYTVVPDKRFKTTKKRRILFITSSKSFANGIQHLLLRLGIISKQNVEYGIKKFKIRGKACTFKKPRYTIYFNKISYIKKFQKYAKPIKANLVVNYSSYNNLNNHYKLNKDFYFSTVTKKRAIKLEKPSDLYNLEVKKNNNYFVSNILLHNCGRAGRPGKDTKGEAISIARTEGEKDKIYDNYILGEPEDIYSKLAVEPVLRTYLLSLISSDFVRTKKQIIDFFSKTFWAHQYKDIQKLSGIIEKMLILLQDFEFIKSNKTEFRESTDFIDALEYNGDPNEKFEATKLGKRVAELYIDPLTAHNIINGLRRATSLKAPNPFTLTHLMCTQIELRPRLKARIKDYDRINEKIVEYSELFLSLEPSDFDPEYEEFQNAVKTAMFFEEWIDEKDEEYLLQKYNIRPGEIRAKIDMVNWLLYSAAELGKLLAFRKVNSELNKLRIRIKYGAREEILTLLKLKNIGRKRARKLYFNKIKDIGDLKKADITTLSQLIGKKTAADIKEQLGEKVEKIKENKRKGQISLNDYATQ